MDISGGLSCCMDVEICHLFSYETAFPSIALGLYHYLRHINLVKTSHNLSNSPIPSSFCSTIPLFHGHISFRLWNGNYFSCYMNPIFILSWRAIFFFTISLSFDPIAFHSLSFPGFINACFSFPSLDAVVLQNIDQNWTNMILCRLHSTFICLL